jgi:pimeloyl-ACP methyl ester carboxylesterase
VSGGGQLSSGGSVFDHDSAEILTSADGEPVALHHFGGEGPGPPLLLCHGNGLNAGMWAAALPTLTGRFRCYGLDLRGHGRSRPRRPDYPVDRHSFAADIAAAVQAIGQPVRFAGHSLGAASSLVVAMEAGQHTEPNTGQASEPDTEPSTGPPPAERFVGLWLFEPVRIPAGLEVDGGPSLLVDPARRRRMDFDSVDDAVARFRSKPPFSGCDPLAVRGYAEIGTYETGSGVRLSCRGEDEARVYESATPLDFTRLAAVDVPVMIVSGAEVNVANALPPRLAPVVAGAIAGARHEQLDGVSHFGPMEHPEAVARSIIEFFAGLGTA